MSYNQQILREKYTAKPFDDFFTLHAPRPTPLPLAFLPLLHLLDRRQFERSSFRCELRSISMFNELNKNKSVIFVHFVVFVSGLSWKKKWRVIIWARSDQHRRGWCLCTMFDISRWRQLDACRRPSPVERPSLDDATKLVHSFVCPFLSNKFFCA